MKEQAVWQRWRTLAEKDFGAMRRMFKGGEYYWAVFVGYVGIERLLKACCSRRPGVRFPRNLGLVRLVERAGLTTTPEQQKVLRALTLFQRRVIYPRKELYHPEEKRKMIAQRFIRETAELRKWLLQSLSQASSL